MTQPIPDPNPLDNPEAAGDTFREDDLIETTGAEDSAWEEDDAQWGEDAEGDSEPGAGAALEMEDPEVEALVADPQADREVERSLQDGAQDPTDLME